MRRAFSLRGGSRVAVPPLPSPCCQVLRTVPRSCPPPTGRCVLSEQRLERLPPSFRSLLFFCPRGVPVRAAVESAPQTPRVGYCSVTAIWNRAFRMRRHGLTRGPCEEANRADRSPRRPDPYRRRRPRDLRLHADAAREGRLRRQDARRSDPGGRRDPPGQLPRHHPRPDDAQARRHRGAQAHPRHRQRHRGRSSSPRTRTWIPPWRR